MVNASLVHEVKNFWSFSIKWNGYCVLTYKVCRKQYQLVVSRFEQPPKKLLSKIKPDFDVYTLLQEYNVQI